MRARLTAAAALLLPALGCAAGAAPPVPPAEEAPVLVIPPLRAATPSPPVAAEPIIDPVATAGHLIVSARDPRLANRRPRSRALVFGEAQGLERQLDGVPRTDPSRATIHRRIAEAYSELAYTASGADATRPRADAIKHYAMIKDEHPTYAQLDEVLYYLGLAYELSGDRANARKSYFELVAKSPSSKLTPLAYFGFGELFLTEAAAQPAKLVLAEQAFLEVLKSPPAEVPVYAEALLRVGELYQRRQDDAHAQSYFDRLRREFPGSEAATHIPPPP